MEEGWGGSPPAPPPHTLMSEAASRDTNNDMLIKLRSRSTEVAATAPAIRRERTWICLCFKSGRFLNPSSSVFVVYALLNGFKTHPKRWVRGHPTFLDES